MTVTTISSNSSATQTIRGNDSLTVNTGITLNVTGTAVTWNLATAATTGVVIDNSGTIQASSRTIDTSGTPNGAQSFTLTNHAGATIHSTGNVVMRETSNLGGGSITVDNSGALTSDVDRGFNIQEYQGLAHFTFTNEATGTLTTHDDGIRLTTAGAGSPTSANHAFTGTISIVNNGTMQTTGSGSGQVLDLHDVNASALGQVTLTNNAGATISSADADAVRPSRFMTIDNYGTIQSHNATISSTGNDGLDFQENDGGVVHNYQGGSIIGARHGITGDSPVSVTNDGLITGQLGSGLNFDTASSTTMTVVNQVHGVITGTAGGSTDGDGIDIDGLANITNSGQIQAVGIATSFAAPDTAPPINEAITIGGGTITNQAGGLIHSVQRAITVDDSNDGNAYAATTITNHGTITGDNGEAIHITDTFGDTISNDGTINGSIVTGDGADAITDTGTITGALNTGGGDDSITLGSVHLGAIDAGAGNDMLTVAGGAGAALDGAVSNLETIQLGAGSTLDVGATLGGADIRFGDVSAQHLNIATGALVGGDLADRIIGLGAGDTIDLKGIGLASQATVGANNLLTLSGGADATLHLDPTQDFSAFRFHLASDGAGGTLLTLAADSAPVAAGGSAGGNEDNPITGAVSASDADSDHLSFALVSGPDHGTLSFAADGSYSYTPDANFNGTDSFNFKANDSTLDSNVATTTLDIAPVNDAPALTGTQATLMHGTEDVAYSVSAADLLTGFTDVDGDTLSITGLGASSGTVYDNQDGTYTVTQPANFNGPVTLSYTVTDGLGGNTAASLGYVVDAVNDAPTGLTLSNASVAENSANGTVIGSFTAIDVDGNAGSSYALLSDAGGRFAVDTQTGVLSVANGTLLDYETSQSFTIDAQVTDAGGASFHQQFTIALTNVVENHVYTGTDKADLFTATSDDNWLINSMGGKDVITTLGGDDTVNGGAGDDTLSLGGGNDLVLVGPGGGVNVIDGGAGYDVIRATHDGTTIGLQSISGIELISNGGFKNVDIKGSEQSNNLDFSGTTLDGIASIKGGAGADTIIGSAANDKIDGGGGADLIAGGRGADSLTGGAGADVFVYHSVAESGLGANADWLMDFKAGTDLIDLSAIDVNAALAGDQAFTFVGSAPFTGLGQLRIGLDNGHVALFGNVSGDLNPEFEIIFDDKQTLHASDFIL
jgi:Ca2+-binding RTX toxin-like protein